ncbi:MAG: CARDB domain-containing protein [Thermoplasmatota archaeon]
MAVSVIMVGGLALWTSQMGDVEESLNVDLWATIEGDQLDILHRGGDTLSGSQTKVIFLDTSGGRLEEHAYLDPGQGRTDDEWGPGEIMILDISLLPQDFTLLITSMRSDGSNIVVLRNEMTKGVSKSGMIDLAVTQVVIQDTDGTPRTSIYEVGEYLIQVRVHNFGAPMTDPYFSSGVGNIVNNLLLYDPADDLTFASVSMIHYDGASDTIIQQTDPEWGEMDTGDYMLFIFTWDIPIGTSRTLGLHQMSVKIIPFGPGEQDYRNNVVTRKFIVDKEIIPTIIPGPDPGIYDIYFSNEVPKSGEVITVTVVVQNSGSEVLQSDHGVNLVVSLYQPVHRKIGEFNYIDWIMDYPGEEGNWRMGNTSTAMYDDLSFPTCTVTDIELLPGAYLFLYFELEARVEVPGGLQFIYASVDPYDGFAKDEGLSIYDGDEPQDNRRLASIQVLPRVLLVDDDKETAGLDMTSLVRESLTGAGIAVDTSFTAQKVEDIAGMRDAPAFSYDKPETPFPAMENYDVVIWVTGDRSDAMTNTPQVLPSDYGGNIQEIMHFLDANGYFFLIGSDPLGGLAGFFNAGDADQPGTGWGGTLEYTDAHWFAYNYLGISRIAFGLDLPVGPGQKLVGVDTGEDGITQPKEGYTNYEVLLHEQEAGNGNMTMFTPRSIIVDKAGSAYFDVPKGVMTTWDEIGGGGPRVNLIKSWSFPSGVQEAQYRAVTMGWDISQIRYLNEKIDLMANILQWFDWEIQVGRDLAVTRMDMFLLSKEDDGTWERLPIGEDNVPKYLDTIEIQISVRNNGPDEESTTVIFYVTGPSGVEIPVTANIPDPRPPEQRTVPGKTTDPNPLDVSSLDGGGGETTEYKLWLALGAGLYTFRVMVDPFHLVNEINEENNDISYSTSTISSLVAENNILIVDDDGSLDNWREADQAAAQGSGLVIDYPDGEPSDIIEQSVITLDYDYEVITTENYLEGSWIIGNGPNIVDLKRFNSVIWVTGDSGSIPALLRETFTNNDIISILQYLNGLYDEATFLGEEHKENMMFVGKWIQYDLYVNDDTITEGSIIITTREFLRDYLGAVPANPSILTGRSLYGSRSGDLFSDAFFGMEMSRVDLENGADFTFTPFTPSLVARTNVRTAFYSYSILSPLPRTISTQLSKEDTVIGNYFRTIFHSWNIADLLHTGPTVELPLNEVLFQGLRWFDTPEDDAELVSRDLLIDISSDHPALGNSYIVKIEVANLGGDAGGGTVRFLDGSTLFKSQYIFLNAGEQVTLEGIWEPLYAGDRTITIWIDRYDDTDEVFDMSNNIPVRNIRVYFFWDDMETGTGNWDHDSTVALINGENPLDYYDPADQDPQTYVMKDWDDDMSYGVRITEDEYRSSPYSFWLEESGKGEEGKADVIISFVIDDSASMVSRTSGSGKTWLEEAKDAALVLLEQLSDDSVVVSIWDFKGNNERRYSGPTDRGTSEGGITTTIRRDPVRLGDDFSGVSGRQKIRNEITGMDNPSGTTILWDAIGEAYKDIDYWSIYYPQLNPVVVVLSDGMDIQASDGSALSLTTVDNKVEGGSTYWAPWGSMWGGEKYYDVHKGKYTIDWANPATSTYWMNAMYQGSMDHNRYGLLYSDIPIYTVGLGLEHHDPPYKPEIGVWPVPGMGDHILDYSNAYCSDPVCLESGTLEYNLWRIADTSDAQYFYAPTADELADIFKELGQLLAKPQDQTRGSEPTRQGAPANYNKWAVTPEFDLSGSDEAILSFFHRYNMVDGANGGYVLVGWRDPLVDSDENGNATDDWDWRYMTPLEGFYTGSLFPGYERKDSFGGDITYGYNGISGEGTFDWDFAQFDLLDYVPLIYRDRVKVMFYYIQYGGGTGDGWWLDDVKIVQSRSDSAMVNAQDTDTWRLQSGSTAAGTTHSGSFSWFCGGWDGFDFHDGIDNSLYTRPIDLTNARNVQLEFYTRFNFQTEAGRPPDGFRVEISRNNGLTWAPLNFGVRAAWGVSGTESDASDGVDGDGKSFTGLGDAMNWVPGSSITRMTVDLDGYTGYVIILRFRVVTNIDGIHYRDPNTFMGMYLDDVVVWGDSLEGTRSTGNIGTLGGMEIGIEGDLGEKEYVQEQADGPQASEDWAAAARLGMADGKVFGLLALFLLLGSLILMPFARLSGKCSGGR